MYTANRPPIRAYNIAKHPQLFGKISYTSTSFSDFMTLYPENELYIHIVQYVSSEEQIRIEI